MAKYFISQKIEHPSKFACLVSFNDKPEHYHEVESLDPKEIDAELTASAERDELKTAEKIEKEAEVEAIMIIEGQIDVK